VRSSDLVLISEARAAAADGSARKARQDARLTQREIADACKVSPTTVCMWEKGHREPRGRPALEYGKLLRKLAERAGTRLAGLRMVCLPGPPIWEAPANAKFSLELEFGSRPVQGG
jgi:DNA-binding XRE family transcriptional regulator